MAMTCKNSSALIRNKKRASTIKRVQKQSKIKDAPESIRQRKLVPKVPKVTDIFVE